MNMAAITIKEDHVALNVAAEPKGTQKNPAIN